MKHPSRASRVFNVVSLSGGRLIAHTRLLPHTPHMDPPPPLPVLVDQDTYVWMEGGRDQEDVLVRVSCRMLSNGATIHVVLSNETPSPPLRIENRSSTQTLCYRLGGDSDDNVRLLEPMRWNSLHWVNDDKR